MQVLSLSRMVVMQGSICGVKIRAYELYVYKLLQLSFFVFRELERTTSKYQKQIRLRKHGFVFVRAPYLFHGRAPSFTTTSVTVPSDCPAPEKNITHIKGGVELIVNTETSVVGKVSVGILDQKGKSISGFSIEDADPIQGNTVDAVASWGGGVIASLSNLSTASIQIQVAMRDAKLYSLELRCARNRTFLI